jgi:hypothetical protein
MLIQLIFLNCIIYTIIILEYKHLNKQSKSSNQLIRLKEEN